MCRALLHEAPHIATLSKAAPSPVYSKTVADCLLAWNTANDGTERFRHGTRLWHGPGPLGNLSVKPGTLDDPSQLVPRYEGWTKRKLPWLRIEGLEASFEEQGSSRRPASAS